MSEPGLVATSIAFEDVGGLSIGPAEFPETKRLKVLDKEFDVYAGRVVVLFRGKVPEKLSGDKLTLGGGLRYQAWTDETCLRPTTETRSLEGTEASKGAEVRPMHPDVFTPPAPDWKLTTIRGEKVSSADLKGKVYIPDFRANRCAPCIELPGFVELHNQYGSRGFAMIGVSMDESAEPVGPFLKNRGRE